MFDLFDACIFKHASESAKQARNNRLKSGRKLEGARIGQSDKDFIEGPMVSILGLVMNKEINIR